MELIFGEDQVDLSMCRVDLAARHSKLLLLVVYLSLLSCLHLNSKPRLCIVPTNSRIHLIFSLCDVDRMTNISIIDTDRDIKPARLEIADY